MEGVLDSVPLESAPSKEVKLTFDATKEFKDFSALQATEYVYEHHVNETTTMSKMNPGLDVHQHPFKPNLTGDPNVYLTDYIVKERLFNFFLNDGND